ncbi:MAG: hypothetical protein V4463_00345 [Pseudomonadota bacterium]
MAAGIDDFISKPYRQNDIFDCLARQLGLTFLRAQAEGEVRVAEPVKLEAADFTALTPAMQMALRDAFVEMNQEKLAALLEQLGVDAPALAAGIAQMAARFRFPELCALLDANMHRVG